jgi:hypothetical protein
MAWEHAGANDIIEVDTVAWLCRALGDSGNPRYRNVLERIERKAVAAKIQRYARQAAWKLRNGDAEQFEI